MSKTETLCKECQKIKRVSAGLRICTCGTELQYGENVCCEPCARKKKICKWCGASLPAPG